MYSIIYHYIFQLCAVEIFILILYEVVRLFFFNCVSLQALHNYQFIEYHYWCQSKIYFQNTEIATLVFREWESQSIEVSWLNYPVLSRGTLLFLHLNNVHC